MKAFPFATPPKFHRESHGIPASSVILITNVCEQRHLLHPKAYRPMGRRHVSLRTPGGTHCEESDSLQELPRPRGHYVLQPLSFARVSPMPQDTRRLGDHDAVYCRPYGIRRRRKTQTRTLTFAACRFSTTTAPRARCNHNNARQNLQSFRLLLDFH